jgi:ABC-type branched-subunit amino acid transport system substrate-binding protein
MRRIPVVAAVLALAVAACGSSGGGGGGGGGSTGGKPTASAPGITATTVTVGGHFPLTGPAAPGYSEIPRAIDAYFSYVNDHGGIHGRKLKMIIRDDGYNPVNTVKVTKQLVLQDKVFAILGGLGTPTHTKVVDYLNSSRVPDIFVSSGCLCWDDPQKHPYTFGWQPDYLVEGKVLGQYIAQHFKGKKVAYFLQSDDFGADGAKGLDMEIPKSQVVTRQTYDPTNVNIGPQMQKIQQSGAEVIASFSIPAFTALQILTDLKLNYKPQMVVSSVGSDPTTLGGLLKAFSKGKAPAALMDGVVTDGYLPSLADSSNSWISLFKRIHDKYIPKLPWDGNVGYGLAVAYTFADALAKAGANPTRQSIVKTIETANLRGPGLVPFRFSAQSHAGFTGVQIGTIKNGAVELTGRPMTTDDQSGAIQPFSGAAVQAPSNGVPST